MKLARRARASLSFGCRASVRLTAMPSPGSGSTRAAASGGSGAGTATRYGTSDGSRSGIGGSGCCTPNELYIIDSMVKWFTVSTRSIS